MRRRIARAAPLIAMLLFVRHQAESAERRGAAPPAERRSAAASTRSDEPVASLRSSLLALSPRVSQNDAQRIAVRAHSTSRQLRREYRVVGPPKFHNFLVNAGIRKRGLCHQWTRDLMAQLATLDVRTLDLHWGIARGGTLREHNSVVVTAKGQPFATGIVLDAWRWSGRLFSGPVAGDRYPWKEDPADCLCARGRGSQLQLARAERDKRRLSHRGTASRASAPPAHRKREGA